MIERRIELVFKSNISAGGIDFGDTVNEHIEIFIDGKSVLEISGGLNVCESNPVIDDFMRLATSRYPSDFSMKSWGERKSKQ
jgi:hypothetical protein